MHFVKKSCQNVNFMKTFRKTDPDFCQKSWKQMQILLESQKNAKFSKDWKKTRILSKGHWKNCMLCQRIIEKTDN